ncbi:hypothetical protein C8Q80DRAFT_1120307 [Daedaleopsis nitida]|nr:hypothetical protein C8Q80DRAFT_1120307 [Daedaleopsis nitida]
MSSTPSSNVVLDNEHLRTKILGYLPRPVLSGPPGTQVDSSLATARLVSKDFATSATPFALWETLASPLRLWLRIPALQNVGGKYTLVGNVTPSEEDWSNMLKYRHSVQEVHLNEEGVRDLDPLFVGSLEKYLAGKDAKGRILLPNLHTLSAMLHSAYDTAVLRLFLSPSVRTLKLFCAYPHEEPPHTREDLKVAEEELLRTIVRSIPNLEHLELDMVTYNSSLLAVGAFTELRRISLTDCGQLKEDPELIRVLAEMPLLEEIENLPVEFFQNDSQEPLKLSGFRKLKTLGVCGMVFFIPRLLATITGPLRTLVVRADWAGNASWEADFVELAQTLPSTVRSLKLDLCNWPEGLDYHLLRVLQPFLPVGRLEEVDVRFQKEPATAGVTLRVTDEDIQAVTQAWPGLRILSLDVQSDTSPTLRGLAAVATQCPALETLLLPQLRTAESAESAGEAAHRPVHRTLRRLSIYEPERLEIPAPEVAVSFLAHTFPALDREASLKVAERSYQSAKYIGDREAEARAQTPKYIAGQELWQRVIRAIPTNL